MSTVPDPGGYSKPREPPNILNFSSVAITPIPDHISPPIIYDRTSFCKSILQMSAPRLMTGLSTKYISLNSQVPSNKLDQVVMDDPFVRGIHGTPCIPHTPQEGGNAKPCNSTSTPALDSFFEHPLDSDGLPDIYGHADVNSISLVNQSATDILQSNPTVNADKPKTINFANHEQKVRIADGKQVVGKTGQTRMINGGNLTRKQNQSRSRSLSVNHLPQYVGSTQHEIRAAQDMIILNKSCSVPKTGTHQNDTPLFLNVNTSINAIKPKTDAGSKHTHSSPILSMPLNNPIPENARRYVKARPMKGNAGFNATYRRPNTVHDISANNSLQVHNTGPLVTHDNESVRYHNQLLSLMVKNDLQQGTPSGLIANTRHLLPHPKLTGTVQFIGNYQNPRTRCNSFGDSQPTCINEFVLPTLTIGKATFVKAQRRISEYQESCMSPGLQSNFSCNKKLSERRAISQPSHAPLKSPLKPILKRGVFPISSNEENPVTDIGTLDCSIPEHHVSTPIISELVTSKESQEGNIEPMLNRLTSPYPLFNHTQRYAFVMDYSMLLKRREDINTKYLVNNSISSIEVDTRHIGLVTEDDLLTMIWNMYFHTKTILRDLILPLETRKLLIGLTSSDEDSNSKLRSVQEIWKVTSKEQRLNYKAILGHSARILDASTSNYMATLLVVILGSILFPNCDSKTKSFLDAVRKNKRLPPESNESTELAIQNKTQLPSPKSSTNLSTSNDEQSGYDLDPATRAPQMLNTPDADKGSIFNATIGKDEVSEFLVQEEFSALRIEVENALRSFLNHEHVNLTPGALVMEYLVKNVDGVFE